MEKIMKKKISQEESVEPTVKQEDDHINVYAFILGLVVSVIAVIVSFIFIRKAMLIPTGNVAVEGNELHYSGIEWNSTNITTVLIAMGAVIIFGLSLAFSLGAKGIISLVAATIFIMFMISIFLIVNIFTGAGTFEANKVENNRANNWFHQQTGYDYNVSEHLQHYNARLFINGRVIDIGNRSYVLEGKKGNGETIYKIRNIDGN
jgi:hypothetical protein